MKKTFTVTIEVNSTKPENAAAADALVREALETLSKQVAALEVAVTLKGAIAETPSAAPAAPVLPKA